MVAGLRTLECPMSVMSDSYKAGHFLMYPAAKSMTAYGEFREPMKGMNDNRMVVRYDILTRNCDILTILMLYATL